MGVAIILDGSALLSLLSTQARWRELELQLDGRGWMNIYHPKHTLGISIEETLDEGSVGNLLETLTGEFRGIHVKTNQELQVMTTVGRVALAPLQSMVSDEQIITKETNLTDPLVGPSVSDDSASWDEDPTTWRLSKSLKRRRRKLRTAAKVINSFVAHFRTLS